MSTREEAFHVVVVGFGPTGATLANLLGMRGVRTLVIEREPEVYTLPRAVHFDHEVMRIFQSVGVAERILPHTGPVGGYEFRNGKGELLMSFDLRDTITSQGWRPDYMFHQPSLERVLRESALRHDPVEVRLGVELVEREEDADGVTLVVRDLADGGERRLRTRFLVGCDGASSPTRELAGLPVDDLTFDEPWLVVDALALRPVDTLDFPRVPLQHCDPARPTTLIPVVGPYLRWEFMLLPGEGAEMQEPERVRKLLARWLDPDSVQVVRSAVYRFHALVGARWRTRRTLLAGDAAHQMPPFLGQGMCAGIRDAANLAWKLCWVLAGRAGDALLDSYQRERAPHVRAVIETAVEMGRIICTRDPELARARDERMLAEAGSAGGGAPPGLPPLQDGLLEPAPRHALVGALALQARVRDAAGREGLLDDRIEAGFTLLWNGKPPALGDEARALLAQLGVVDFGFSPGAPAGPRLLEDCEGAYARWLDAHQVRAVLVRPDHVVYGVAADDGEVTPLLRELAVRLADGAAGAGEG